MRSTVLDYYDPAAEMRRALSAFDELSGAREFIEQCVGRSALKSIVGDALADIRPDHLVLDALEDSICVRGMTRALREAEKQQLDALAHPLTRELEQISANLSGAIDPALISRVADVERSLFGEALNSAKAMHERALEQIGGNHALERLEAAAASYRNVLKQTTESFAFQRLEAQMRTAMDELSALDARWNPTFDFARDLERARESVLPQRPAIDSYLLDALSNIGLRESRSVPRGPTPRRGPRRAVPPRQAAAPAQANATPVATPSAFQTYAPSRAEQHCYVLVRFGENALRSFFAATVAMRGVSANDVAGELDPETYESIRVRAEADGVDPSASISVMLEYTDVVDVGDLIRCDRFWPLFQATFQSKSPVKSAVSRLAKHRNPVVHGRTVIDPRTRVPELRVLISGLALQMKIPLDLDRDFPDDNSTLH